jgi:hypothetical protein
MTKPSPPPPKAKAAPEPYVTPTHTVTIVKNQPAAFWNQQTRGFLKEQCELRGYRFTTLQTMGKKEVNGKLVKVEGLKQYGKPEYLKILKELLSGD